MATKTDGGNEYTSAAYLYVPDANKPSTWKLRIEQTPGDVTVSQLGKAAAALGPGFRGKSVEMPAADRKAAAKALIGKYRGQGVKDGEIPSYLWGIAGMAKPKGLEDQTVEVYHAVDHEEVHGLPFIPVAWTEGKALAMKATNLQELVRDTREAFYAAFPFSPPEPSKDVWVEEVWDTYLIVEEYGYGSGDPNVYYQVPYGKTQDGTFTFPDRSAWVEVEQTWTPAPEAKCLDIAVRDTDSGKPGAGQPPDTDILTVDTKERRDNLSGKSAETLAQRIGSVVKAWLRDDREDPQQDQDSSMVLTFKQDDGLYRWVSVSSTAVQDKEREIVSRQALESAVKLADATGQRGSIDFWHVDGLDFGWCDFQAVHGYALIESGLWSPSLEGRKAAEYHMANPDSMAISIKFLYDPDQTEIVKANDGGPVRVYKDGLIILNRAFLPRGKEAAWFTTVGSMEVIRVDKEKTEALVRILGQDLADGMLARAEEVPAAAKAMGLMLKEYVEQKGNGDSAEEQTDGKTLEDGRTTEPDGATQESDENPMADLAKALAELPEDRRKALLAAMAEQKADQEHSDHKDVGIEEVLKAMAALSNQVTAIKSDLETVKAKAQEAPRASGYRASQGKSAVGDGDAGNPGQAFEDRLSHDVAQRMASKLGMGG